jgi:hypothetical protein
MTIVTGVKFAENLKVDASILELTLDKKYT